MRVKPPLLLSQLDPQGVLQGGLFTHQEQGLIYGISPSKGYNNYTGLGWSVLVCKSTPAQESKALTPAQLFEQEVYKTVTLNQKSIQRAS